MRETVDSKVMIVVRNQKAAEDLKLFVKASLEKGEDTRERDERKLKFLLGTFKENQRRDRIFSDPKPASLSILEQYLL